MSAIYISDEIESPCAPSGGVHSINQSTVAAFLVFVSSARFVRSAEIPRCLYRRVVLLYGSGGGAGVRANEIAALKWEIVPDVKGVLRDAIALTEVAAKRSLKGKAICITKYREASLRA